MLNCLQATRLIEIKADQPLSWGTLLALRVHLRLCPLCRRYCQQSSLINRVAAAAPASLPATQLSDDFKARLSQRLQEKLNDQAPDHDA